MSQASNESFYTDKAAIRASFDAAAHSYDAAAVLQREVADRMAERLDYIKLQPQAMLDAGCGTGYMGKPLQARYGNAQLIELDLAPAMLQVARGKHEGGGLKGLFNRLSGRRAVQVCGDIEALPLASASVDLVWSSLTLQWCNTPDAAFREFHRVLKPGGLLMFSSLGPDTLKELRAAFAGVDGYSHVNQFIDMHDLGDALGHCGFSTPVMDMEMLAMTYADVRGVMDDLKGIGAHNLTHGRRQGMMGKTAWQRVLAQYERLRNADGLLPCSYEVVYGHAWKPEARPAKVLADGSQVIEFRPRPNT
ncbi:Malonyl-[acyl-carrier protein] O-methyltransferase [Andreprevotia sp. IGB-42]|uniref:malonyl-ACP O-methyltransferase BioC n=1 Tax=Andreprevotia sp. IGB-42 TaxID=2497473 RepID=UPI0013591360|nr:malonyl-ACP O-methyltransferase BioC [Andreprevotia sp. IGB-42]KAF0812848.1 Malonyl-[acyl-carrier protein] O-methyltransferase [Andreprevotia sp. IGB-42]